MIDLNVDDLNNAAVDLLNTVMPFAPAHLSLADTDRFRQEAFKRLVDFVYADAPCALPVSVQLFKECLKTSTLANLPAPVKWVATREEAVMLWKQMDFTPYSSLTKRSGKSAQLHWVANELLRCQRALENNRAYLHEKCSVETLSINADKINKKVMDDFFAARQRDHTLNHAAPEHLAQYVDKIIAQVRGLQQQFNNVIRFSEHHPEQDARPSQFRAAL